jgi:FAD:protein FMN transferase
MSDVTHHESPWRPSRRDLLLIGVAGFVAGIPIARRRPLALVRREVLVMGTLAEFAVAHRDPAQANAAIDAAIEALQWVDATMSHFNDRSDVGRANARAASSVTAVTPETHAVLEESLAWAAASDGLFDPCLGRATRLWDVKHRHQPPADDAVKVVANQQLYRSLEIGTQSGSRIVRFHHHDISLDLGGIAKGYGVDRAVKVLRAQGIEHALVGAGGDLYALGRSPSGEPWRIGIQSPFAKDALAGSLPLEDAAIATSGDYQQYFEYHGRRYHHLIDPRTGAPSRTPLHSVSVVAGTCMAADAGATLAFADRTVAERVLSRRGARIAHSV